MSRLLLLVLVVALIAWLLRRSGVSLGGARSGGDGFRLRFRDGRLVESGGRPPRAALHAIEDVALRTRLSGDVRLTGSGDLAFSGSIPEGVQQQLRNTWLASQPR